MDLIENPPRKWRAVLPVLACLAAAPSPAAAEIVFGIGNYNNQTTIQEGSVTPAKFQFSLSRSTPIDLKIHYRAQHTIRLDDGNLPAALEGSVRVDAGMDNATLDVPVRDNTRDETCTNIIVFLLGVSQVDPAAYGDPPYLIDSARRFAYVKVQDNDGIPYVAPNCM